MELARSVPIKEIAPKGSFTQAIWVGNFTQRCDFKIEISVSNRNHQRQVLIVLMPVYTLLKG